jgi:DNA-directed RNA polymerase specialized sigma24 family protein
VNAWTGLAAPADRGQADPVRADPGRPEHPAGPQVPEWHPLRSPPSCSTFAERLAAVREAFTQLPPSCQQLITLLIEDPPVSYAQISAKLGIPAGSIGPTRGRCLDKLRCHPAIAALINAESASARNELCTQAVMQ